MKIGNRRKLLLRKSYLWSFFIVVILVDLLITILLFSLFSSTKISNARNHSIAQLEQVCTATDILSRSLNSVADQIATDSQTSVSLSTNKLNRLQEASTCTKLKNIKSTHPYLRYAGLYNSTTQRYISNAYVGTIDNYDPNVLFEALGENRTACIFRKIGESYPAQSKKALYVYTFIFVAPSYPEGDVKNLIILDVDQTYYDNILKNIRIEGEEQQITFSDYSGNIITKRESQPQSAVLSAVENTSELKLGDMYQGTPSSGSMKFRDSDGKMWFVTYAKTMETNWMITNMVPYSYVLQGLGSLAGLTSLMFLITLLFGYIISLQMSKTLYAPIKTLYENYVTMDSGSKENELDELNEAFAEMYSKTDQLEQGLISAYHETKNQLIRHLLFGNIDRVENSMHAYKELGIDLFSPYYTVMIVECIPMREGEELNGFIHHYALENITKEILSSYCSIEFFRLEENRLAVILYLPEMEFSKDMKNELGIVIKTMRKEFSEQTTICIGSVVDSWKNINMCYEQVKISINSRSSQFHGKIFFSMELPDPMRTEQYYNGLHAKFADYIRTGNLNACSTEFDHALASMSNISFKTAKSYFKHVAMSVLDSFAVSFDKEDESIPMLLGKLDHIDSTQSVKSLKLILIDFFSLVMHRVELNKKGSNQDAAQRAKTYIDQNFTNPELSITMVADIVNLSPAYLGKIFSSVTSFTFNDYLLQLRMKKAAELLTVTKQSIQAVSQRVGILNSNYFFSLFKKYYNMTPSSYRKKSFEDHQDTAGESDTI